MEGRRHDLGWNRHKFRGLADIRSESQETGVGQSLRKKQSLREKQCSSGAPHEDAVSTPTSDSDRIEHLAKRHAANFIRAPIALRWTRMYCRLLCQADLAGIHQRAAL